jgi:hypothetical protein
VLLATPRCIVPQRTDQETDRDERGSGDERFGASELQKQHNAMQARVHARAPAAALYTNKLKVLQIDHVAMLVE